MISAHNLQGVPGHVDALATLTLTDVSGEPRDDITVALQEDFDPENPEPVRLEAADLDPLSGTLVGANIEGTTSPQWIALASTGEQPHVGRWRVYARIEVEANVSGLVDSQIRLSYRSGDGPLAQTDRPIVTPHLPGELVEVDLGLANIREAEGSHAWAGQVEIRGETAGLDFNLRELLFLPATHFARARAPQKLETPTTLEARDEFDQASGDLAGKALPDGSGNWAGAGDADDFVVGLGAVSRSAVSDTGGLNTLHNGRFALAPPSLTNTAVEIDLSQTAVLENTGSPNVGAVARYADIDNWLVGMILRFYNPASAAQSGTYLYVYKRVAGGTPEQLRVVRARPTAEANASDLLRLIVLDTGAYAALLYRQGTGSPFVVGGNDSDLAAGGALDEGQAGPFDWHPSAPAVTRTFDNFALWEPDPDHAIHANQSLRLTHEKAERESEDGTRWGRVPHFEGARLKIPPSTRNDLTHRLVVKQDRNDLTQLPVGTTPPAELCTNPNAETNTTGWASAAANTFERDTSLPTLDGLPAGITTGFHLVTDGDAEGAFDDVAVESGKTYRFSAYAYLDTTTATGVRLQVRNAVGATKADSANLTTLDAWTRLDLTVTADATGTWQFRPRQSGAGGADWYFTAVSIRQVLLTPTLTVTPRVALVSG